MYKDLVISKVDRGRLGLNKGLPHGLTRMLEFIPGIQQKTYYLIGGETGTGKSAFTNNNFIFTPIEWYLKNKNNESKIKLKVFYYSFEIPKEDMFIKAINRSIYLKTGLLLDINYALSRGKYRMSDEHYKIVIEHAKMLDEFNDIMVVKDVPTNPTGLWKDMLQYAKDNGTGITNDLRFEGEYTPNDPNEYVMIVIDHISLSLKERGFATKDTIDKLSEYLIVLRNKCGYTPVVVQQLNRSLSSTERLKFDRLEPQLSDFKDSGNTQQDANIVLTLFSPNKYEVKNYRGYDIDRLKDRFRALGIAKNRDGEAEKVIGLKYVGECGYFEELPRKDQMLESDYKLIESIKKSF